MNIALTGATGFVGRYQLAQLLDQGHHCRCWYRPASDRTAMPEDDRVEWISGTLGDVDSCHRLLDGCQAVVHTALQRSGVEFRGGEGDVVQFAQQNLLGTLQLIEAARKSSVERFVFISTCAVHEKILDDRLLDEKHPTWPITHYGAHKAALENFVHSYGWGLGMPICALRPTGVYGATHPIQNSKWFKLVQAVVRGESVSCRRGGKEVHAADVARATQLLLTSDGITGEAFNCYDRYISELDVATIAKRLANSPSKIDGQPLQPKHQIETSKIRALGMKFGGTEQLEQTVQEMIDAIVASERH